MSCYHASIEGAQHGAKSLPDFLAYAKRSGATGAQPSNYVLQGGKLFQSAKEIRATFEKAGMTLDGVSAHCPIWVHTTAWTESPTITRSSKGNGRGRGGWPGPPCRSQSP